ncbi:MAG: SRPBCC family protein [Nitrospira sp.]|nr:MAG: SRPBCC family protein [Nitrospira sp.]
MSTIETSIEVNVPEYTAYAQWMKFEEFPQFMEGVKEIKRLDGKRFHWKAEIAGQEREWDSEITEQVADQRLAWTSRGSFIKGWVVTFHRLADAKSKVTLQLEYDSQGFAEPIGEALEVVSRRVQGDLERFKTLIEKRWRPAGRETIFDIAVGKTY